MIRKYLLYSLPVLLLLAIATSYFAWNIADPKNSCASCHEINPSVESALSSAHRNLTCSDCHGTALSNGLHSVSEKLNMIVQHFSEEKSSYDISMKEKDIVLIMEKCKDCQECIACCFHHVRF